MSHLLESFVWFSEKENVAAYFYTTINDTFNALFINVALLLNYLYTSATCVDTSTMYHKDIIF